MSAKAETRAVEITSAAEMLGNMTTEALDVVLAVLIIVADGNKKRALHGVECMYRDMIRNVEVYYAKTGAET